MSRPRRGKARQGRSSGEAGVLLDPMVGRMPLSPMEFSENQSRLSKSEIQMIRLDELPRKEYCRKNAAESNKIISRSIKSVNSFRFHRQIPCSSWLMVKTM